MDNFLSNGAILPHGLLGHDSEGNMAGFNKSYKNFPLRLGVVIESFPVSSSSNISKLTEEYNVLVFEQNEDRGSTSILYRNCMSSEGLGSIADFFEKSLRVQKNGEGRNTPNAKGQNGAVVLLLCLDGMSDKAIIICSLTHPDRKSKLTEAGMKLEGEFNGVNIKVNDDGSTSLTFKGATDNNGKAIDKSQGNTTLQVKKDGTYEVSHEGVTQTFEKAGKATLSAKDNIESTTKKDYLINADGSITLTANKDFSSSSNDWTVNAQGSAMLKASQINMNADSSFSMKGSDIKIEAEAMASIKSTTIVLDGLVSLGGQGGQPVLLLSAQMMGIGNLGIPVISNAIAGFSIKVLAT